LCRTGEALLGELDRRVRLTFGIPQAAATALAVIDGAGTPLTPSQVSDRVLIASATMTATLDLLEHRGRDFHTGQVPGGTEITQESGIHDLLPLMQHGGRMLIRQTRAIAQ
jgi:hypothetical protein